MFFITVGGIAFFMFGMRIASDSLQKLMANRMRDLIAHLSNRPFYGVVVGVVLTLMIQSSGAVTSMLVGLGSAGVITISQVMSVILGTTIGTTFTVQLLSLNIAQYGLLIFTLSFFVQFVSKNRSLKLVMSVFMGFGLIFWGLELISFGTQALKNLEMFSSILLSLSQNPFLTIILTAFFTAIVHSSVVTIGFAMSLAMSGSIDLVNATYWVYGANIGTTAIALIAAMGGNYVGKQVAWAHALYKVASVAIFYYFTSYFADVMTTDNPARDVANIHTVFNVLAAIVFYPFIGKGAKLIERLWQPSEYEKEFGVKY